jgi:parallel beta-helix repeat protein
MVKGRFILVGLMLVSIIFLVGFVGAQGNDSVPYIDPEIYEAFEGGEWVNIIVDMKNISDVDKLISNFSEEEMRDVVNRPISPTRFGADVTEEGFNKLINDGRVESVYLNRIASAEPVVELPYIDQEIYEQFGESEWIKIIIDPRDMSEFENIFSVFPENELRNVKKWPYSPRVDAEITEQGFNKLVNDSRIESIYFNAPVHATLDDSVELINVDPDVWNLGYTGDGVKVCVIDSGINATHPDLAGQIFGEYCYCSVSDDLLGSSNCCPDGTAEDNDAEDYNGHGTHVTGTIASRDSTYKGVANDSDIYVVKVLNSSGNGIFGDIGKAIDWCRINAGANVISMSIGDGGNYPGVSSCPTSIDTSINNAYNNNIPVIVASGNDGYKNGINYPACSPNAISVGAVYDKSMGREPDFGNWASAQCHDDTTTPDKMTCFSNRASNLDLLAPGCKTNSTDIGGEFRWRCGTSMATPHVAGAASILLEKDSSLTPDKIKEALEDTSTFIYDGCPGCSELTYPRIDVLNSINSLCTVGEWTPRSCGGGSCPSSMREYTRTTDPLSCDSASKCESDSSCLPSSGTTYTVCKAGSPTCDYDVVQDALDVSSDNDIVEINDGAVYEEDLNWSTSDSGVILNCQDATIKDTGVAIWIHQKNGVVITDCNINASVGIRVTGTMGDHEILVNDFDADEKSIEFKGDFGGNYIINNEIENGAEQGVYFNGASESDHPDNSIITGNTFVNNERAIDFKFTSSSTVSNNHFENNTYGIYLKAGGQNLPNTIEKNNVTYGSYGVYIDQHEGNTISNNNFCAPNSIYDIFSDVVSEGDNSGEGNTCENTIRWSDTGVSNGCSSFCDAPPSVMLLDPLDHTIATKEDIDFTCSTTDNFKLVNITLYHNISGTWLSNQTETISGVSNVTTFTVQNVQNGTNFVWNCLAYDNMSRGSFANTNWSVNVSLINDPPANSTIEHPNGGETFNRKYIKINWTLSNDSDKDFVRYFLDYSSDSGSSWSEIISDLGYDNSLADDSTTKTLDYSGNENKTIYLRIPKNATVASAKFDITGLVAT